MMSLSSHKRAGFILFILLIAIFLVVPVSAAWTTVTLTDATGTEVIINEQPTRIVSLSPTVAEVLFAVGAGDQVIASTTATNYPEAAAKLPTVGDYYNINNESVISYMPDLVICEKSMVKTETIEYLRGHGCKVLVLSPESIESTLESINTVGKATGHVLEAENIVSSLNQKLNEIKQKDSTKSDEKKVRVAHLNWYDPLNVSGSGTMQDEIIRASGCENAFSDVNGWGNVNIEKFLVVDPDMIIITKNMGTGDTDDEVIQRYFGNDSRLQQLSAYKNNNILVLDADLMSRSGPRFIQAVEKIRDVVYSDKSESPVKATATSPGFAPVLVIAGIASALVGVMRKN